MIKLFKSKALGAVFVVNEEEKYCRYIYGGPHFEYNAENIGLDIKDFDSDWGEIDFLKLEVIGRGRLTDKEYTFIMNNNFV